MKYVAVILLMLSAAVQAATVEAVHHGEVFFAKDERRPLVTYRLAEAAEGRWMRGETVLGEGAQVTVFFDGAQPVVWQDAAGVVTPAPELPPSPGRRPADLEAGIAFFAPEVVYDDEVREFYWEVFSKLPASATYTVTLSSDRANRSFPDAELAIPLGGRTPDDRFAPGEYCKFPVRLDGSELKKPLTVTWRLSLAGTPVAEQQVAFIPVASLPELQVGADGRWYDALGRRVIPVLHRRELTEQRELELGKRLRDMMSRNLRVLVMAEDFNGFQRALGIQVLLKNRRMDFHPWFGTDDRTPDWGDELPAALTALRQAEADVVVIVPPSARRRPPGRGDGDWARLTDLLMQAAWSNPGVARVVLATPLPDPTASRPDAYEAELRKLMRCSDSDLFEYAHLFTARADWREAYRVGDHEWAAVPLRDADRAAKLLVQAL